MYKNIKIAVIIPAYNEEECLSYVLKDIPEFVDTIIVVDNGSTDNTVSVAKQFQTTVVHEHRRGYGSACLQGINAITDEEIIVFIDADYSDYPEHMGRFLDQIIDHNFDCAISNRFTKSLEKNAMSFPQYCGNKLAVWLVEFFWNYKYKDLGPFRAITTKALLNLHMEDLDFGWTIEMQIKAIKNKLEVIHINVPYRNRIKGKSKISGTVLGVLKAGYKIISRIFYYRYIKKD